MKKKLQSASDFSISGMIHRRIMDLDKDERDVVPYIRANISPEYWPIKLDDFIGNKKAVKLVKRYVEKLDEAYEHGLGFIFLGGNGVGKTTMQMMILKAAVDAGYSAFHITLPEIFHYIKLGFDNHSLLLEIHNLLRTTDFLAVGELGKDYHRQGSEMFMRSEFDMIFRHRRSMLMPTSLDTNMDLTELYDTYGESLMSLFAGSLKEIEMKGKDYRKTVQRRSLDVFFES